MNTMRSVLCVVTVEFAARGSPLSASRILYFASDGVPRVAVDASVAVSECAAEALRAQDQFCDLVRRLVGGASAFFVWAWRLPVRG